MKLSRRELILLAILLLIGIAFVEYRFIVAPGIEEYRDKSGEIADLQNQIDTINLNLAIAETLDKRLEENIEQIEEKSAPYIDGINPDILLHFMHNRVSENGLKPLSYNPSRLDVSQLNPAEANIYKINYQLKELVKKYELTKDVEVSETDDEERSAEESISGVSPLVEYYNLQINAQGSYDQLKKFIDDLTGFKRTIIIPKISLIPSQSEVDMLSISMQVNFYAITKLKEQEDQFNTWPRDPFTPVTDNPFNLISEEDLTENIDEEQPETENEIIE